MPAAYKTPIIKASSISILGGFGNGEDDGETNANDHDVHADVEKEGGADHADDRDGIGEPEAGHEGLVGQQHGRQATEQGDAEAGGHEVAGVDGQQALGVVEPMGEGMEHEGDAGDEAADEAAPGQVVAAQQDEDREQQQQRQQVIGGGA